LEGQRATTEVQGQLPKAPELMVCLKRWQQYYYSSGITPRIKSKQIISGRLGNPWIDECRRLSQELRDRFTIWLKAESFRAISDCLREKLSTRDSIRILIRTSNSDLRRLPWHEWDLLQSYNNAEIAFSPMTYDAFEDETIASTPPPLNKQKVKILAILGHSEGINIERDRQLLAALPDAEVEFLVEPDRAEIGDRLWEQPWDILFFAGHSHTEGNQGRIFINSEDSLTLSELKYALQQAIRNGLQLAIFNSCDGLGLAEELEQLHLPQMIVMREPIPDAMAQAFLQDFLKFFAQGQSLYLAERWAREKLHPLENVVPCASWLPVICQNNLSVLPPNWE
ncbi:MAG TPA: CHAT domain-containing protein, partial [Allocoleopsis sp.]